ncbi:MAG: 3-oxoacyl-[acyl-carrier-protein] reductase [Bacilli bacterium]|jgi:3-oxoacyl-[acyl-carrier protein] reductase|nr:3-oxoacyl-[acyl-carrier-protein] reductase [Bacilli bacterium]
MDKIAIVTGGTTGIGLGITKALLKKDYFVIVTNYGLVNEELINDLKLSIKDNFNKLTIIDCDVTKEEDVNKLLARALEMSFDIDILVNCAGITNDMLLMKMTKNDFTKVIDANLVGTFNMCQVISKKMIKQKYGRIINISSVIGEIGNVGQANYAASKAGVIGLSKSIAKELGSRNITVNCVAPGFIKTSMTESLKEDIVNNMIKQVPVKRLGEIEDVVNLVMFLAQKETSYITGQVINVCGGMVM